METKKSARELAGARFKEGYNCAEAVLRTFRDELKLDLSDEALKIATGFGGGVGSAGCMCGALTGAIMVINLLQGRTSPDQSRSPAYKNSQEFHQKFTKQFGATCCRVLNPNPFGSPEQRVNCLKITGETAELLMRMIEEKKLSKDFQ